MTTYIAGIGWCVVLLAPATVHALPRSELERPAVTASDDSVAASGRIDADSGRSVGINYQYERLTESFDPWQMLTLDASDRIGRSKVIVRLNLARRFAQNGTQLELEAYPKIGARSYLYLNAARRIGDGVFIRARGAAEAYHNFPRGWEASLGGRYFDREEQYDLFGLTGTLGRYVGNYWHSLRPTFVFRDGSASRSLALTSRRYFADRYNYIGVRASAGSAPDEGRDDVSRLGRDGLRAYSLRLERAQSVRDDRYRLKYGAGFEHDEFRRDAVGDAVARRHFIVHAGVEIPLP